MFLENYVLAELLSWAGRKTKLFVAQYILRDEGHSGTAGNSMRFIFIAWRMPDRLAKESA